MPQNERNSDKDITIRITDESGTPLPDIEISINDFIVKATDEEGSFFTYIPQYDKYNIHIAGNELYHSRDTIIENEGQREIYFSMKLARK